MISGTGFYGSNDPTNSVKALKEDKIVRIWLKSYYAVRSHSRSQILVPIESSYTTSY